MCSRGNTSRLRDQNNAILKRNERAADKLKSLEAVDKELKHFFSLDGFAEVVGTSSLVKKAFWSSAMIALFIFCMNLVDRNRKGYQASDVVTVIKLTEEHSAWSIPRSHSAC